MSKKDIILAISKSTYLKESAIFTGLQEAIHLITGLIQVWVLARFLPRDDYGIWGYCASFSAMACVFTLPGITQSIAYGAAHKQDGALWAGVKLRLRFGILATIALLIFAVFNFSAHRETAGKLLLMAAFLLPAQQAFDSVDSFLMGSGNFKVLFMRRVIVYFVMASGLSLAALLTKSVLICGLVQYCLGLILSLILFLNLYKLRRNDLIPEKFSSMNKSLSAQSFVSTLSRSFERPLLSVFVTFRDLAAYNLAQATLLPVGFGRLIDRILFSRLARKDNAISIDIVTFGSWLLFFLGWIVYAVVVAGLWLVIPVILPHYLDVLPFATILLLQLPFAWASKPGLSLLLAREKNHESYYRIMWLIIASRIICVALGAIFYGMKGASYGWVFVEAITFLIIIYILKKIFSKQSLVLPVQIVEVNEK